MKRFVFHGVDRPDAADIRRGTRAAHADYQHRRGNPVGGPLLDSAGQACGTLIIFEAPDQPAADALMANDPYVLAGLFAVTALHEFQAVDWPVR